MKIVVLRSRGSEVTEAEEVGRTTQVYELRRVRVVLNPTSLPLEPLRQSDISNSNLNSTLYKQ